MGDRGIDRDDQVQVGEQSGGVGEVSHILHQIDQREMSGGRRSVLLQAEKPHVRDAEQGRQPVRRQGAAEIDRRKAWRIQPGIARPHQADPKTLDVHPGKARAPGSGLCRIGLQIGSGTRDGLQGCAQGQRHAEHRAIEIEFRQFLTETVHPVDTRQAAEQPDQRLLHRHDHPQPTGGRQWGIAAELQRVTETALGINQQRAALRRLTLPLRLREALANLHHMRRLPAPLVFLPSGRQISLRQQRDPQVEMTVRIARPQVDGAPEAGDGRVQAFRASSRILRSLLSQQARS